MIRTPYLLAPILLLATVPAFAGPVPDGHGEDERFEAVVVYGSDPCPTSSTGDIIVCARKPESQRYRIPKEVRQEAKQQVSVGAPGWASSVQSLEAAGQVLLPNSCSAIGTNGFTGCSQAALHQWYLERQMDGRAPAAK